MNMNLSRRTWIGIAVAVVVVLLGALYFFFANKASAPSSPNGEVSTTTETGGTNTTPQGATGGAPAAGTSTGSGPSKTAAPYSVETNGGSLVVTSNIAGVVVVTPINTDFSVTNGVFVVKPPQSKNGESLRINKTTGAYADSSSFVTSVLSGSETAFTILRAANTGEYNPGNGLHQEHIVKIDNRLIDDTPAVRVRVTATGGPGLPSRDFYVTWIHTGITNWYIVQSAQASPAENTLTTILNSIRLIRI